MKPVPALHEAIDQVIDQQLDRLAIQKRVVADLREIWLLQPRFEKRNGQAPFRLLGHLRFRAGYDFLLLRQAVGQAPEGLADWWTEFIEAEGEERRAQLVHRSHTREPNAKPRLRRRPRNPSQGGETPASGAPPGGLEP